MSSFISRIEDTLRYARDELSNEDGTMQARLEAAGYVQAALEKLAVFEDPPPPPGQEREDTGSVPTPVWDAAMEAIKRLHARNHVLAGDLRHAIGRAKLYAHDAKNDGHEPAAEGFHEISGRLDTLLTALEGSKETPPGQEQPTKARRDVVMALMEREHELELKIELLELRIRELEEAVFHLTDALKEIADSTCCMEPDCTVNGPMCDTMVARAALAGRREEEI